MDNPRKLAHASLVKAEASLSFSNIEVNTVMSRATFSKNDASLYTALYMGVIEKLITLDYIISKYSSIPIEKIDIEAKNALRLGIYQLVFMDKIPDYSAVSESVELCPKKSKGFVNAVLRSFLKNNKKIEYPKEKWQEVSIKASIPLEVLNIFRKSYGDDVAISIAESSISRRGVSVRINTLKTTPDEVKKALDKRQINYTSVDFSSEILIVIAPVSEFSDLIDTGCVFVQDVSSFMATKIFSAKSGDKILDACACPGGKSFSCAIDMKNEGSIISCDLHKNKLSLVAKGAKKLGINIIETREQNGKEHVDVFEKSFDKVLCDVPCSGLGVISKKPEIKYKDVKSFELLPSIQSAILENCSRYVKIGGELMYSTCTLNKAENTDVVSDFLNKNKDFVPIDFEIANIKSQNGMYTFMTHTTATDGFFVAKMKRI